LNKNNSKSKEIKDAATIVIVRKENNKYKILMGQRGKEAVFMPNKFVFPGGAYEKNDSLVPFSKPLPDEEKTLLSLKSSMSRSESLAATVIRELWEETGLKIAESYHWNNLRIHGWDDFYKNNIAPDVSKLKFFFRRKSANPSAKGISGPITTKSIFRKSSFSTSSFLLFISIFILSHLLILSEPALPGIK